MKRIFDIFCAAVGLIVLLPLFGIVALLVKLGSSGPVFFIQRRMGRDLKPFDLYKFRTMVADAPEKGISLTTGGDPRVTGIGRVLRRTKIDELPQLFNVLRGDMSFVGPRPEVEKYVDLYRDDYHEILKVRPGITDIASLTYRNEEEVLKGKENPEEYYINILLPEKLRLAREYVRRSSMFYDLRLIVLTVFSILYPRENIMALIDKVTPYRRPIVVGMQIILFALANFIAFYIRFEGDLQREYLDIFFEYLPVLLALRIVFLFAFSLDKGIWRYVSMKDLINISAATTSGSLLFLVVVRHFIGDAEYPRSIFILDWFLNIFFLGGIRMFRRLHEKEVTSGSSRKKIIVFGAGDAADMLIRDIEQSSFYPYDVVGLIDDNPRKKGLKIRNVPILGTRKDLAGLVHGEKPDEFLIAIPTASRSEFEDIVKDLRQYGLPIKTVPSLWSILSGRDSLTSIKMIEPEDILFRAPAQNESATLESFFKGKRVMITGAGGSIGSELSRQVASFRPEMLILYERHEESLYKIDMVLRGPQSLAGSFVCPVIGDILDEARLEETMLRFKPEIVLHAAAYKHVPLMEENSSEAFKTNVFGTRIVAEKARDHKVGLFVLISTDKAVNPVNVMGMTKKIAEEVIRHLSEDGQDRELTMLGRWEDGKFMASKPLVFSGATKFVTVRFGNVLESSGSVVPLFNEQIKRGGPVTVTHPQMTRYFMTIPEAVTLVLQAATMGRGGEVFVLDMGTPVKILDLAKRMISLYGYRAGVDIDIAFVGLRPGEKLFEELFNIDEIIRGTSHPKINMAVSAKRVNHGIVTALDEINLSSYPADIREVIARLAE